MSLLNEQPIIYNIFFNAIKKNKIFHAYLICGENHDYLKYISFYLSASLVCDNFSHSLACEKCCTCKKVIANNYEDLIFLDGSSDMIKKENIDCIFEKFSNFALNNNKNKNICILHLIENISDEASNSLLKFLEEPPENSFLFLTTANVEKVLPTIISRCQRLNVKPVSKKILLEFFLANKIPRKDSEILSFICENVYDIKSIYNKDFKNIRDKCFIFLNCIGNKQDLIFITNYTICKTLDNKKKVLLFLNILVIFLRDILYFKNNQEIYLKTYEKLINKLSFLENIDILINEIEKLKGDIYLNINLANVLEHLAIFTIKNNIKKV